MPAPRRAAGNVTLMTVARAVGTSPTTVSNAYNRPHKLSPALRERILATAPRPRLPRTRSGGAQLAQRAGGQHRAALRRGADLRLPGSRRRGVPPGARRRHGHAQHRPATHRRTGRRRAGRRADLLANAIVDGLVVWTLPDRHPLLRLARERNIPSVIHGSPRTGRRPVRRHRRSRRRPGRRRAPPATRPPTPSPSSPCPSVPYRRARRPRPRQARPAQLPRHP